MTIIKLKKEQQFAVEISIGNKIRARVEPGGTLEIEDDYLQAVLQTGFFDELEPQQVQEIVDAGKRREGTFQTIKDKLETVKKQLSSLEPNAASDVASEINRISSLFDSLDSVSPQVPPDDESQMSEPNAQTSGETTKPEISPLPQATPESNAGIAEEPKQPESGQTETTESAKNKRRN